jgi:hypothetical protein
MKCIACKSEIEKGATLCSECGSYQNWRRHFTFTSTVLSLLVALISVIGLVAPIIYEKFHKPISSVNAGISSVNSMMPRGGSSSNGLWKEFQFQLKIGFLITNSGEKTGLATGGTLDLIQKDKIIGKGIFSFPGERGQIKVGEARIEELNIPIVFSTQTQLPVKIREGANGSILNATNDSSTVLMQGLKDIDVVSKIVVVQSNGRIDTIRNSIHTTEILFSIQ